MPAAPDVDKLVAAVQRWADGKATLKEVTGYNRRGLYAVARTAYAFFHQGKVAEARTPLPGPVRVTRAIPTSPARWEWWSTPPATPRARCRPTRSATKLAQPTPPPTSPSRGAPGAGPAHQGRRRSEAGSGLQGDLKLVNKARALLEALQKR